MGKMTVYHGSYTTYVDGVITREQFWVLAKFKYPTHQINFCTLAALKCVEFVSSEEVKRQ